MDDCNWPNCGCPKLTVEPWCKATVHPSIKLIVVQPIPVLDALAMRERAAKACDEFCSECARAIRALPITLTDAELLAAVKRLPEMKALVSGSDKLGFWMSAALCDPAVCAEMKIDIHTWLAALAPFIGKES